MADNDIYIGKICASSDNTLAVVTSKKRIPIKGMRWFGFTLDGYPWKSRNPRVVADSLNEYIHQKIDERAFSLRDMYTDKLAVEKIRMTLREYYRQKRERYGLDSPEFFDIDLRKLFVAGEPGGGEKASRYIRRAKKDIMDVVERWTGEYKYRINEALKDMIQRCDELDLRVGDNREALMPELTACLTMLVMNKLHSGGFHISL